MPSRDGQEHLKKDSTKLTGSTGLLDTLTDSPALPALIEKLKPSDLKRLVDAVGLEDAGELVTYASSTQLAHLVDESIWASAHPGNPESLSVPELLRWFDLWLDIGDGFIAEKLVELGEGFCALVFAKLITVNAADLAPGEMDEFSQVIGEYVIRSRFDDEWDTLQAALGALWDDYPDFLEATLGRLNFRHSILGIGGEDDAERVLEADASHDRESRKEGKGFVGATTAGAFLAGIAAADLDVLLNERVYDAETAEYFKRGLRAGEDTAADAVAADPAFEADSAARESTPDTEAELDELQRELEQYEILKGEQVALLTGPETPSKDTVLPIRRALATLAAQQDCFRARTAELIYLSNLVVGAVRSHSQSEDTRDDGKLSESDAANLVMSTCNLGGSYALWAEAREAEESADGNPFVEMLRDEPGLVRLFRIGWKLLDHLPVQAASRLTQALSSAESAARLSSRSWVIGEVESLLNQPSLIDTVRAGEFDQAQETIKVLAIALEPAAVAALCLLVDGVPRLASLLERGLQGEPAHQRQKGAVSLDSRYITTMKDLLLLERFLGQLPAQVSV